MKDIKYPIGVIAILATLTLASLRPTSALPLHQNKKPGRSLKKSSLQVQLQNELKELEKQHPGQIGIFIKDLNTGEEYSLHAEESWYLASTVKIPVAIEVLRNVDAKKISLDDTINIIPDDYVDGNGPLKVMKPGTPVSIRYLIEQMIIWSDNMATDMLIRTVGLENVNKLVKEISPTGFSPITTLKDVRRHIYGELHTRAFELSGRGMLELKGIPDPVERISKLASILKLDQKEMKLQNLEAAYDAYYKKGLNSASPRTYSKILEALWEGKLLSPGSREFLLHTMLRTQTGKKRIRAGLKEPLVFAHKTGTQYNRIGDVGYIWNPNDPKRKPLIVVSFVREIPEIKDSAKLLEKVARIISKSGVL